MQLEFLSATAAQANELAPAIRAQMLDEGWTARAPAAVDRMFRDRQFGSRWAQAGDQCAQT